MTTILLAISACNTRREEKQRRAKVAGKMERQPLLPGQFRKYKRRWYMLFVVMMFNISNAVVSFVVTICLHTCYAIVYEAWGHSLLLKFIYILHLSKL